MNKLSQIYYNTQGLLGLKKDDILLASFPKSGITWLRFFLFQLLNLAETNGQPVSWENLDETLPELGQNNLFKPWPYISMPRFVKTHKNYLPFFRKCRSILLVRDPRDVMVSFYCYQKAKIQGGFSGTFSQFIRHKKFGLLAWCKHFTSWRDHYTILIKYEDLIEDDVRVFGSIIAQLNICVDPKNIKTAAENARFSKMREMENKNGTSKPQGFFRPDFRFTRKGVPGDWQNYFTANDLLFYEKYIKKIY
ncbi:sulfotransferase domain-containing protein [candidate division KSB1 bacterium]|nr:sulfotransferase domain-containing protein [candidate division KSB1 bacterium]